MFNVPSFFGFRSNSGVVLPFEFTINTANTSTGSSNSDQFKLPLFIARPLNFTIDWGDGNTDTITIWNQAETLHTYASSGVYTIRIVGEISGWKFNDVGDKLKMLNVSSWGTYTDFGSVLTFQESDFFGCVNLTSNATDTPILFGNMSSFFRNCFTLNGGISNWDTSQVTSFNGAFRSAISFNQDIGSWDVGNVTIFLNMFLGSPAFNNGGSPSINNWNTSSATNMVQMFFNVINFNQPINNWDISNVVSFNNFINNGSYSHLTDIYNSWSLQSVKPNVTISFGSAKYNASAQASKDILTNAPNNWTITDGGVI